MSRMWSNAPALTYPHRGSPGSVHGSPTSRAGADAIRPKADSLEQVVLSLLTGAGPNGLTDEEIQVKAEAEGIRSLMRPRRATLLARGEIVDSGRTRPGSKGRAMSVWVLAS